MNFYERHIGDYLKDTAHLSLLEHGVYTRLLDVYYTREGPLAAADVARLIGARSKDERAALDVVLREFFITDGDAWLQVRCEREIAAYRAGEPDRELKRTNEDNRMKRHRDERSRLFHALTNVGQHAPWNIGMNELREMVKRLPATAPETVVPPLPATAPATPATATQSPLPTTHYPVPNTQDKGNTGEPREAQGTRKADQPQAAEAAPTPKPPRIGCPEGVDAAVWADWLTLRKAKRAPVTATVLEGARDEAAKAGMSLEAFLRVWCKRSSQGLEAAWLKPDERGAAGNGRGPPPIDTATRDAEARRLLGFAPAPPAQETLDA